MLAYVPEAGMFEEKAYRTPALSGLFREEVRATNPSH